ncbi:YqaE/Pmp3 family membrane protein [Candidatus Saccharibacteria bacterium]|nr:YqaE/Pmp3 family membrane protein [Candidatus Saccharibacteria bacterium]
MAKTEICPNCGYMGQAKKVTKGSILIEIVLWLCFLIPGLIYSIWRLTSKHLACPQCGAQNLVPLDSPRGRKLQQELSQ